MSRSKSGYMIKDLRRKTASNAHMRYVKIKNMLESYEFFLNSCQTLGNYVNVSGIFLESKTSIMNIYFEKLSSPHVNYRAQNLKNRSKIIKPIINSTQPR